MAESDWLRQTRACSPGNLPAAVSKAIRAHEERYNLGDLLSAVTAGVETISRKTKKGLLGSHSEEVHVAALLTSKWLVWVIAANRDEPTVMTARLKDIVVQDYASTKFAAMVPDTGLEISGSFTDVPQRGSAFIGLGPEPASAEFRSEIMRAIQAAKA